MRPFDLQKALAGEPVVTRDGRAVTQVTKFDVDNPWFVCGVIERRMHWFQIDGKFSTSGYDHNDLFMKETKRTVYANIYPSRAQNTGQAIFFGDEVTARLIAVDSNALAIAIPIEVPVD